MRKNIFVYILKLLGFPVITINSIVKLICKNSYKVVGI